MNKVTREAIELESFTELDTQIQKKILDWRNHPEIRNRMNNSEVILEREHFIFIDSLNDKPFAHYWLSRRKGKDIGVVYLHIDKNERYTAEWGFYLAPGFLGSGLGLELGYESICIFFENFGLKQLSGYVKSENKENITMQKTFGFQKKDKLHEGLVHFYLTKEKFKEIPETFKQFRRDLIYAK